MTPQPNLIELLNDVFRSDLDAMNLLYQEVDGQFVLPAGYVGIRGASMVLPHVFQQSPVARGEYGKPFKKLNRTMFPMVYQGNEGIVQLIPGESNGIFQTIIAQVGDTSVLNQDRIYSRPNAETAYLTTYKTNLPMFNGSQGVKVATSFITKLDLSNHLAADNSADNDRDHRKALNKVIEALPDRIRIELWFKKNNPRVAFLHFPDLREIETKGIKVGRKWTDAEENDPNRDLKRAPVKTAEVMHGLRIHPISIMTVDSWTFINKYLDAWLKTLHLPFKIEHVNSIQGDRASLGSKGVTISLEGKSDPNNNQRYGKDYIKFLGEFDPDFFSDQKKRRVFFDNPTAYEQFLGRATRPTIKDTNTHEEMYREAVRRARQDALENRFALDSDSYHDAVNAYFLRFKKAGSINV